jgi:hypothetical protein
MYNFNKRNFKVTKEERQAGIIAKQVELILPTGFYLCVINISLIETDQDKHQRGLISSHLGKIKEEFNGLFVSLPVCTLRHDPFGKLRLYYEDGQHTAHAINQKGAYKTLSDGTPVIHAICHFDLSAEQAAAVFTNHNTACKPVNGWDSFRAGYLAGNQSNLDIENAAIDCGLTTPIRIKSPEDSRNADLQFADEYMKIRKKHGKDFITNLFKLHKRCFYIDPRQLKKPLTVVKKDGTKSIKRKVFKSDLGYKGVFLRALVGYIKQENLQPMNLARYFKDNNCVNIIMNDARKIVLKQGKVRVDKAQIQTAIGNYVNKRRKAFC